MFRLGSSLVPGTSKDSQLRPSHGNARWSRSSTPQWAGDAGNWRISPRAEPVSPSLVRRSQAVESSSSVSRSPRERPSKHETSSNPRSWNGRHHGGQQAQTSASAQRMGHHHRRPGPRASLPAGVSPHPVRDLRPIDGGQAEQEIPSERRQHVFGEIDLVEPETNRVRTGHGTYLEYDELVIATGVTPRPDQTPGMNGPEWRKSSSTSTPWKVPLALVTS